MVHPDRCVSIVVPIFNESACIEVLVEQVKAAVSTEVRLEFIFVDDGSTDDTWLEVKSLSRNMDGVEGLRLSRNFGKEAAICAGLEYATGDAVIVMDGDLQHPPSLVPEMIRLWDGDDYSVVEAVKSDRGNENLLSKVGAWGFYRLFSKMTDVDLESASDFILMDHRVVVAWRDMPERNTFFRGMSSWLGFPRARLEFSVPDREAGRTRWATADRIRLAINAITSFSFRPLQLVSVLGLAYLVFALVLGLQTLYVRLSGEAVEGFTTLIFLILLTGGGIMTALGVIGEYLGRIYEESKRRPRFIVSERCSHVDST